MADPGRAFDAEALLAHGSWLRGLALRLVRDADTAEDLVQETWVATMQRPPEPRESVRPWLASVLRNALRMRARGEGRRVAREQASLIVADEVPSPEVLVARAEAQRTLVDLVLRLDEPYRSTVLLHYCEGMALADIARAHGIPASTVRGRLKTALAELRRGLDIEPGGRKRWAVAVLGARKGVLVAQKSAKLVALALILLAVLALVVVVTGDGRTGDGGTPAAGSAAGTPPDHGGMLGARDPDEPVPAWLVQRDAKSRRIAGRVIFAGAPVGGATVELANLATESGRGAPARQITNPAGEFDFGVQPPLVWSVRASAPGRAGVALDVDLRDPRAAPPPDRLELVLGACDAALFGTVRDASGGPIARARLARLSRGPGVPGGPAAETDDRGAYELCVQTRWPGTLAVEVSAAGYGTIWFSGQVVGRVNVDFALVPEAVIVGRVVWDHSGDPVPGAHVFVPPGPPGVEMTGWRGTFADRDGRFRLERVAPGRHVLIARADGASAPSRGAPVEVAAGQTAEVELRVEVGATVRGVVRQSGKPVAGARVAAAAVGTSARTRPVVSQDDGTFVLGEVPRGEIQFTASPYDVVSPRTFRITEATHDGVVLEVEAMGAIVGRVTRGGRPVDGADVTVGGPNEHELPPVRTGADGEFAVRGLRAGRWTVHASSEREGAFGRAPGTVHVTNGSTAHVTIDLEYAAAIEGVVVDQQGAPVPGVSVGFQHTRADDGGFAVTASDGSFRAAMMTGGGQYRPSVRRSQLSDEALRPAGGDEFPTVTLADGASEVTGVVLAVQLDRLAIAGMVVDTGGAPVADARVTSELVVPGQSPRFLRWLERGAAITDVDGRFTITDLSAGDYAIQARSPAGAEATLPAVRAGRTDVSLVLPAPGRIEGTLARFAATPQVTAFRIDAIAATPAHGTVTATAFAIRDLSPGEYQVLARTPAEAASAVVTVAAGETTRVTLTSGGSGTIAGRVREFRTGAPVEGMTCRALPAVGPAPRNVGGDDGARTDPTGAFELAAVPAGEVVVSCIGLGRLYSDGLRVITLSPAQRAEVEVPVVAWRDEVTYTIGSIGAELAPEALVPRLVQVRPGGPAAAAGFQDGDVIVDVEGASVTALSPSGVHILIANRPPGTAVPVTVMRAGKRVKGTIVLGENDQR